MKKLLILLILISSCSTYQVVQEPYNGPWLDVPDTVKVDTLNYAQLKWKLKTDFRFRYDFATYAMNQPYSWYMNNRFSRYWRPFNSFDIYWNSTQYWTDWAFGYGHSWHSPFYNSWWHNSYSNNNWINNSQISYSVGRRSSRPIIKRDKVDIVASKIKTIIKRNNNIIVHNKKIKPIVNNKNIRVYDKPNNNVRIYQRPNTNNFNSKPNISRQKVNSTKVVLREKQLK